MIIAWRVDLRDIHFVAQTFQIPLQQVEQGGFVIDDQKPDAARRFRYHRESGRAPGLNARPNVTRYEVRR